MPAPLKILKFAAIGGAAAFAAALLLAVIVFIGVYIVRSRRIMREFDAFCLRHPIGSAKDLLIDDPFVDEITPIEPDHIFLKRADALAKIRSDVKTRETGQVHLMWTHTPPFGRIFVDVDFQAGRVTSLKVGELD